MLIKGVAKKYDFMQWWKWWAPRCPHLCPAIHGFNLPCMNQAEIGQSKLKQHKPLWLTEAIKVDMVELTFQSEKYKKFVCNIEKISGQGPTLKKRTERERVEERCFIDQFCDVIQNGDLLDEGDDPNDMAFMPSARAKHKALRNDIGIQEKLKKGIKQNVSKEYKSKIGKKLPERTGRGFNRRFASDNIEGSALGVSTKKNKKSCSIDDEDIIVPTEIEKEFMKGNRVYYIVLDKGYEKSPKTVTYCRGCEGKITIEDKKFPNNMVFHYR